MTEKLDWAEVRGRLRRDRERLLDHYAGLGLPAPALLWAEPSYLCVVLHRISAYHFRAGRRLLARLFWQVNLALTGADFSPLSNIGAGLVVLHPMSTQVFGRIGRDCTLWGHSGIGGGRSNVDIGAGPGLPVLGDRVTLGARAFVLGPFRIGDDCYIGPGCIVMRDIEAGAELDLPASLHLRSRRPSAEQALEDAPVSGAGD